MLHYRVKLLQLDAQQDDELTDLPTSQPSLAIEIKNQPNAIKLAKEKYFYKNTEDTKNEDGSSASSFEEIKNEKEKEKLQIDDYSDAVVRKIDEFIIRVNSLNPVNLIPKPPRFSIDSDKEVVNRNQ